MSRLVIACLVDALRYDMLTPELMPRASKLVEQGTRSVLVPPPYYVMHPLWFAGKRASDTRRPFYYDIATEGKAITGIARVLHNAPRPKLAHLVDKAFSIWTGNRYGIARHVPSALLPSFCISERLAPWEDGYLTGSTLFSEMEAAGVSWRFAGYPGSDQRTEALTLRAERMIHELAGDDASFLWMHFGAPDWAEHEFGPESPQVASALRDVDAAIGRVNQAAAACFSEVDWVIFGDHGASEVHRTVDVTQDLADLGKGRDFVYFLDSTAVRIWARTPEAIEAIESQLRTIRGGRLLRMDELKDLGFLRPGWHVSVFWCEEGTIILPNFWQGTTPVRGMHGYLAGSPLNRSAFATSFPLVQTPAEPHEIYSILRTRLDC